MTFNDPFAFRAVDAESRNGDAAAINQGRSAGDPNQSAPRAGANEGAETRLLEIEREAISARTAPAVNQHGLRARIGDLRPGPILAIAHAPIIQRFAAEQLDKTVRNLAAAIEPFVDDHSGFGELGPELTHQLGLPMPAGIRHVNVAHLAFGSFVDFLAVLFDPRQVPQTRFTRERLNQDLTRALDFGLAIHRQEDGLVSQSLKSGVWFLFDVECEPVHCQQVIALFDIHAGLAQW